MGARKAHSSRENHGGSQEEAAVPHIGRKGLGLDVLGGVIGLDSTRRVSSRGPILVFGLSQIGGAIPKCVDSGFLLSLEANEKKVLMFDTGNLGEFLRIQHLVTVQWIQIMYRLDLDASGVAKSSQTHRKNFGKGLETHLGVDF